MSLANPFNKYTCHKCFGSIITVDRDEGTTPFVIGCRATPGCRGVMQSSFYRGFMGKPTFEWRKPTADEIVKASPAMKEHFLMGGLDLYPIEAKSS